MVEKEAGLAPAGNTARLAPAEGELRQRVRQIIAAQPTTQRTYLLNVLHAVQDEFRHIPLAAAEEIHHAMGVPLAEIHTLVSFYDLLSIEPEGRQVLHICQDPACHVRGAKELAATAERVIGPEGQSTADGQLSWHRCSCLGLCDKAPAALVGAEERAPLTAGDVRELGGAGAHVSAHEGTQAGAPAAKGGDAHD